MALETWEAGPTTIEEVADLIRRNLAGNEKKSDFTKVVVVPSFSRPEMHEEGQIVIKGIRKLQSLSRTEDGRILGRRLSCRECILLQVLTVLPVSFMLFLS